MPMLAPRKPCSKAFRTAAARASFSSHRHATRVRCGPREIVAAVAWPTGSSLY
jgi:hypothetical protein